MSTIGVRAAKAMGTTLSQVVKKANASGVINMKPNGALTKEGRNIYQAELKKEGVKSFEALVAVAKKAVAETKAKLNEAIAPKKIKSLQQFLFEQKVAELNNAIAKPKNLSGFKEAL